MLNAGSMSGMANWRYAFLPDFLYGFLTGFLVTPKVRKVSAIQDQRCALQLHRFAEPVVPLLVILVVLLKECVF
jgi:hypothetical protein